jgi:DNA-directed RNA polymerase subunit RPC12/RpoP
MQLKKVILPISSNSGIVNEMLYALNNVSVNCPECRCLSDDDQYTCTSCWKEGGNGQLSFSEVFQEAERIVCTPDELKVFLRKVQTVVIANAKTRRETAIFAEGSYQYDRIDDQSIVDTFDNIIQVI